MVNSRNFGPSNVKEESKPQGPVPTETPPSSPAASISSTTPINRADVERKLQNLPARILGSDDWWNFLAYSAARYWELAPIAEDIKKLARNYGDRPATFQRKIKTLRKEHWHKLVRDPSKEEQVAWYFELQRLVDESSAAMLPSRTEKAGPEHRDTLPENLSDRKLQAAGLALDWLEAPLAGRRPAETNLKDFIDAWGTLAAPPAGRPQKELNREAFELVRKGTYANKKSPYDCICRKIDPNYAGMSEKEQSKARRARREGVRRLEAAKAKKKRAKAKQRHETP